MRKRFVWYVVSTVDDYSHGERFHSGRNEGLDSNCRVPTVEECRAAGPGGLSELSHCMAFIVEKNWDIDVDGYSITTTNSDNYVL